MRRAVILIIAVIMLSGCEQYATYTPSAADLTTIAERMPEGPTKDAVQATAVARYIAAQEAQRTITTAQAMESAARAELERQTLAMTAEAQSTIQAQQNAARATTQALDVRATTQALDALATIQAGALQATATTEARSATATVESRNATATAESHNATATTTAYVATATRQAQREAITQTVEAAEAIFAAATVTAVHQQTEIDGDRQVLTTFGGWGLLITGYAILAWILYQLLPIIKIKLGQIKRDERGDLPGMATATAGGAIVLYDFARAFGPGTIIDAAIKQITQPIVTPTPKHQEGTTKRAQFVDMAKGGRPRPMLAIPKAAGASMAQTGEQWQVEQGHDDAQAVNWPSRVNLLDVFADKTPSLNHLVIGAYPQPDGRLAVVGESLHRLMHILCCGISGWGKSTFLSSFVWQLAQCQEPVSVVAIDISGSEFNLLRDWGKLQFPVARSDMDAIATLNAVAGELKRRRELFEQFPQARNLARYNQMSDDDLEPWVILLDEGAALLARRDTGDTLRDAIQTSRQYGLYCILSSVSVNHKVLETQTRDQFSTRLAFRLPKSSMRIVLDETPPEEPARPGRAWVRLAGREMVQIQAPIIGEQELVAALQSGGPAAQLPETARPGQDDREQRIRELAEQGLSKRQIALEVFGYAGASAYTAVSETLEGTTTTDNGATGK